MTLVPVGRPGEKASGSFTIDASIETGPIAGKVEQTFEIKIAK